MNDLERFQKQFGPDWAAIVASSPFAAAMTLLNVEKIRKIAELTDDEIATRGTIILADLRGHLKHENALLGLHELKKFVFQNPAAEEYPDPAEEARREAEREEEGAQAESEERGESQFPFPPPPKTAPGPVLKKKKLPAKKKPRKIRAKR